MKRILFAGVAAGLALIALGAALGAAPALAADIPARMPTKAPPMVVPDYNWSGWYVGINAGGAWGRTNWHDVGANASIGRFNTTGGMVGGTIGANWQFGRWVLGLESDMDWTNIKGANNTACAPGCETRNNWLGTTRGRVGYAVNNWVLPYFTGGAAYGDVQVGPQGTTQDTTTKLGWTVGGGVEARIAGNWTAKLEYLRVDLGRAGCSATTCPGFVGPVNSYMNTNIVRGGLNYRFAPTQ